VRATQNYTFWRYATDNMTAGVAAARREPKGGWTRYGPPSYWSKLGRSRGTRDTRDYVAGQIAETGGVSMSTARREILPHLSVMTHHCKNRELTVAMAAKYDLDTKHVSFVTGSGEDTNKVQSIVEDAERLREERAVENAGGAFDDAVAGGGESGNADGTDGEAAAGGEGGQASLDAETDAGNGTAGDDGDDEEPTEEVVEDDDQQSGLSDFM
jgi:replication factor C large subunit